MTVKVCIMSQVYLLVVYMEWRLVTLLLKLLMQQYTWDPPAAKDHRDDADVEPKLKMAIHNGVPSLPNCNYVL